MQGWLTNSSNVLYKIVLCSVYWFFKILYRNKIYGAENVCSGAAILAANHSSFYDPPLLSVSTPYEVHFLARKSLFDVIGLGRVIRKLNAHPVTGKAQDISVFKMIIRLMKEGKKVIIFPEGTRSKTGEIRPFKPGVSLLILKTGAPVIPAYLHGTFSIWPAGQRLPKLWGRTACVFGKPLYFSDKASAEEISSAIFNEVQNLKLWYENTVL